MAISVGTLWRTYTCLSTDTKPANVDVGTRLYETDTNRHFVWSGSAWADYVGGPRWL